MFCVGDVGTFEVVILEVERFGIEVVKTKVGKCAIIHVGRNGETGGDQEKEK